MDEAGEVSRIGRCEICYCAPCTCQSSVCAPKPLVENPHWVVKCNGRETRLGTVGNGDKVAKDVLYKVAQQCMLNHGFEKIVNSEI